ncbi:THUMP domain containing protein [Cordyceps fumosorosea ARSEF 2679]|uniref:THUMP domain containing protein n=1 Tax=Cordyceps fumosorosea (strain ARSEF 2679) TaxID=1081104 RepID=A0A168EGU2_CORFA|nr:THUMP domain containing protein [Cordyceps fumosorosea ARSEF 2679]OAA73788.1 THUMP domain containing protein [Cordyceps fumosorosea ARSEF 2679]
MSENQNKRKEGPSGAAPAHKKSKQGSTAGKWKTPQQKSKMAGRIEMGSSLDVGDEGIWVTYARGMNTRAFREFNELCHEYGESMYGIAKPADEHENAGAEGDEDLDIEASIEKELAAMKAPRDRTAKKTDVFRPINAGIECVFFMKTARPVEPDVLVRQMCEDARKCPDPRARRCKYINRLTPVLSTDKATDKGIERVARRVLTPYFELVPASGAGEAQEEGTTTPAEREEVTQAPAKTTNSAGEPFTYAIRHNIRNHNTFKSDEVIKKIAGLVDTKHKVNLSNADKVILVEIFQLFCSVSVVDGPQWEELKRYNMNSLYGMVPKQKSGATTTAATNDS